jgi:glycosyltransferase involved in cell wall biosynthesis
MLRSSRSSTDITRAFLWAGQELCRRILKRGLGDAELVYGFNSAALEIAEVGGQGGVKIVVEQTIAPRSVEIELLARERESFPDWEADRGEDRLAQEYIAREKAEWSKADRIVCGSEFVREGILACGGPAGKCVVVPYGVDLPVQGAGQNRSAPLRVLSAGTIGLRKGSPYVLKTARCLKGKASFRMVGGCDASDPVRRELNGYVEVVGPIPRSQVGRHFEWADVFLLPSICEGSATVTYEALAAGLPVVTTANSGSVVRDGVDGFIVPIRDHESIAARLNELADGPELRQWMSTNARQRAREFTVAAYGDRLLKAILPS